MNAIKQTLQENTRLLLLMGFFCGLTLGLLWLFQPSDVSEAQSCRGQGCLTEQQRRENNRKSYCERNYGNRTLRGACETGFSAPSEDCARRYDKKDQRSACNAGRSAASSSSGGGSSGGSGGGSGGGGGSSGSSSSSSSIPDSEAPETATVDVPEQEAAIKYKEPKSVNNCGDVATFFKFDCGDTDSSSAENSPIFKVLLFIVNILTTLVGLAAVGGIIAGGIIYSSARDNAEQTKKGITFVVNAVLAIILFAFMFAILNFIIPGGLFT